MNALMERQSELEKENEFYTENMVVSVEEFKERN